MKQIFIAALLVLMAAIPTYGKGYKHSTNIRIYSSDYDYGDRKDNSSNSYEFKKDESKITHNFRTRRF